METGSFFNIEGSGTIFTATDENTTTTSNKNTSVTHASTMNAESNEFTPLAPAFQAHTTNELINLLGQQEPHPGDTAPSTADIDEMIRSFSGNTQERAFNYRSQPNENYFTSNSRAESVASSRSNLWSNVSSSQANEQTSTFDFLIRSVSAANSYISMLTRDQLSVLESLRPSLLYEFLREVARVRSEKRTRRAQPNECAFCKNNGENEDHYTSHCLKDWRGRVLCPILRAFRCPRCGATGDRAHTIKYCPESDTTSNRRMSFSSSLLMDGINASSNMQTPQQSSSRAAGGPPPPPATPTHNTALSDSSIWSPFGTR